ncbi:hypothetical protein HXZ94_15430 [Empedobacter falsenii]|uniref:hypothetical protein n=1 Tax=Empedobacter falsenii TaxID=343874 RepID=UPI0025782769|nr:hypothetical protein [Empedobacter falsenii]MDM1299887.1 hypothetical protein [Empedobacter falsenii]MDM1319663.1 hypothetical protein [Empedobacter falsenii]
MKKILFYIFIFISSTLFSQVGVNTDQPTRALDINGDLRIRDLKKVTITDYPDVLVTDVDGNIEKHSAQAIIDAISDLTVETKELYFDSSPDGTKIVPCGRFNFRFSNTTKPQMSSVTNLSSVTTIYYLSQLKANENSKTVLNTNKNIQLTTAFVDLDSTYALNSVGEYYMSFPGDNNFYRIVFLARKMNDSQNSYSIVCEKF